MDVPIPNWKAALSLFCYQFGRARMIFTCLHKIMTYPKPIRSVIKLTFFARLVLEPVYL